MAGLAEVRATHPLRREGAQVDRVRHREAVVVAQPLGVLVHADADEAVPGVGEEAAEGGRDEVGVEELEDEAAAVDAELEQRDGVLVGAEAGAPLDVEPHHEPGPVRGADIPEPPVHGGAGGRHGGGDHVAAEGHLGDVRVGGHGIAAAAASAETTRVKRDFGGEGDADRTEGMRRRSYIFGSLSKSSPPYNLEVSKPKGIFAQIFQCGNRDILSSVSKTMEDNW
uniref:Uncharacterized protein n=1 Tax=Oryza brachyantha TaxID=4533 RepID=J3L2K5_ORYBR